jgi:hypothetical protein
MKVSDGVLGAGDLSSGSTSAMGGSDSAYPVRGIMSGLATGCPGGRVPARQVHPREVSFE